MSDCGIYDNFKVINEWADGEAAYELRQCDHCGKQWEQHWFAEVVPND